MKHVNKKGLIAVTGLLSLFIATMQAQAKEVTLQELERRINTLTEEIEGVKFGGGGESEYKSTYGFAPAAAKVYHVNRGVSIGGYGEMVAQDFSGEKEDGTPSGKKREVDFLRMVLYTGYKFTDKILFNSELEFEHASTAGGINARGEASVEFAYLDFFLANPLGVRTGLLLVPMGLVNELHEPPVFHGARRPNVESNIIPSTWRENGAGVFGETEWIGYRAYLLTGLQAVKDATPGVKGFSASSGLRDGRSKGAKSLAENLAWAGRIDVKGIPGTLIGLSSYMGKSGQGTTDSTGKEIDGEVTLWDVHALTECHGLELRGLYTRGTIDDVAALNAANGLTGTSSIGEKLFGGYIQAAYNVLSLVNSKQYLAPFFRYERYDTQQEVPSGFSKNPANSRIELTYGLTYKPHPNTVIKADFQKMENQANTGVDQFNMAVGFLF